MIPPDAPGDGKATPDTQQPAALSRLPGPVTMPSPLETLRIRPDFLAAARAKRVSMPAFLLQARQRGPQEIPAPLIRIGFTASKKTGNAVARNRAKRRLRAIARDILPTQATPGWDYVLVARPVHTATRPFADLAHDLTLALKKIHQPQQNTRRKPVKG